ncbi:hypothetical protein AK812_SmicGene6532 [Symbiodinium microadriaticum]|uniref:Uncharacterized protein n=1 Tax=Symbiodinium microadriaticum TaxID=2951 RepID=A0A1Q9EQX8_SYMMI|nr:hypothetical protein AK812_SmicGene6532 [Symbiodinium microadriaticum]
MHPQSETPDFNEKALKVWQALGPKIAASFANAKEAMAPHMESAQTVAEEIVLVGFVLAFLSLAWERSACRRPAFRCCARKVPRLMRPALHVTPNLQRLPEFPGDEPLVVDEDFSGSDSSDEEAAIDLAQAASSARSALQRLAARQDSEARRDPEAEASSELVGTLRELAAARLSALCVRPRRVSTYPDFLEKDDATHAGPAIRRIRSAQHCPAEEGVRRPSALEAEMPVPDEALRYSKSLSYDEVPEEGRVSPPASPKASPCSAQRPTDQAAADEEELSAYLDAPSGMRQRRVSKPPEPIEEVVKTFTISFSLRTIGAEVASVYGQEGADTRRQDRNELVSKLIELNVKESSTKTVVGETEFIKMGNVIVFKTPCQRFHIVDEASIMKRMAVHGRAGHSASPDASPKGIALEDVEGRPSDATEPELPVPSESGTKSPAEGSTHEEAKDASPPDSVPPTGGTREDPKSNQEEANLLRFSFEAELGPPILIEGQLWKKRPKLSRTTKVFRLLRREARALLSRGPDDICRDGLSIWVPTRIFTMLDNKLVLNCVKGAGE